MSQNSSTIMTDEQPDGSQARTARPARSVADALTAPRHPWRTVAIIAAATVAVAAAAIGTPALVHALTPTPKPVPVLAIAGPMECDGTIVGQGDCVTTADQQIADQQEAAIEAANAAAALAAQQAAQAAAERQAQQEAAAKAAAKAAAPQNTAHHASGSSGHPAGTPLPFIPSSDPQNANGGDYEDPSGFCTSGSASTVNGVPTCD